MTGFVIIAVLCVAGLTAPAVAICPSELAQAVDTVLQRSNSSLWGVLITANSTTGVAGMNLIEPCDDTAGVLYSHNAEQLKSCEYK